ncbi:MAG: Mur ligase domain-containing protein [Alistipes finegoldii]
MKTLKELLRNTPVTALHGDDSAAVAGLVYDSRAVGPGDCFFAVRGTQNDGHDFIPAAVAKAPPQSSANACPNRPPQTSSTSRCPTPQARWPTWPRRSTTTPAAR